MELCVGCDHAAYDAKIRLIEKIEENGYVVLDMGHNSNEPCHYPDYAIRVAHHLQREGGQGILLCGSGIGVSMVANRFAGIRAALCRSPQEARLSRMHNDANILCLGSRINTDEEVGEIVEAWLETDFEEGRHQSRIDLFNELGERT